MIKGEFCVCYCLWNYTVKWVNTPTFYLFYATVSTAILGHNIICYLDQLYTQPFIFTFIRSHKSAQYLTQHESQPLVVTLSHFSSARVHLRVIIARPMWPLSGQEFQASTVRVSNGTLITSALGQNPQLPLTRGGNQRQCPGIPPGDVAIIAAHSEKSLLIEH